jgi:hypothetical protein
VQAAVASFTRYGFEAAAITAFAVRASALAPPQRTAILRFDHPYAAVAVAGKPTPPGITGPSRQPEASPFTGLPLFSAWIHEPHEAELERPSSTTRDH